MNVVFIVPTGIGAEIGGHAGDATPAAKLIGAVCDTIVLHPNVVNASDINEMPPNSLYVEGSILDRFLRGEIWLKKAHSNRILLAVNTPITIDTINTVSGARATIGADIKILELKTPLKMTAFMKDGRASGEVSGWLDMQEQLIELHEKYDALAVQTPIDIDKDLAESYLCNGGVNPWGGIEAIASKLMADALDKPLAHAPYGDSLKDFHQVVDPRMAAEMVSVSYLHCILKGLHRAPRIDYNGQGMSVNDIDCLISPIGCIGEPHWACIKRNILIIVVMENETCLNEEFQSTQNVIHVDNYLEAAGVVAAMKAGIDWRSVRRPLTPTIIL